MIAARHLVASLQIDNDLRPMPSYIQIYRKIIITHFDIKFKIRNSLFLQSFLEKQAYIRTLGKNILKMAIKYITLVESIIHNQLREYHVNKEGFAVSISFAEELISRVIIANNAQIS
jgi:hypothetical protein